MIFLQDCSLGGCFFYNLPEVQWFFTVDGFVDSWPPGSGLMVFVDGKQKNSWAINLIDRLLSSCNVAFIRIRAITLIRACTTRLCWCISFEQTSSFFWFMYSYIYIYLQIMTCPSAKSIACVLSLTPLGFACSFLNVFPWFCRAYSYHGFEPNLQVPEVWNLPKRSFSDSKHLILQIFTA